MQFYANFSHFNAFYFIISRLRGDQRTDWYFDIHLVVKNIEKTRKIKEIKFLQSLQQHSSSGVGTPMPPKFKFSKIVGKSLAVF